MRGEASSKRNKKCNAKPTKCTKKVASNKDHNDDDVVEESNKDHAEDDVVEENEQSNKETNLFNVLTLRLNQDGGNSCLRSCDEKVVRKLESILNEFTCKPLSDHLDGDQIRRRIQEEKCVSKISLEDIKLYFTNALTLSGDTTHCTLASKFLRIFIDFLDVSENKQLELTIESCDVVITVHQYFVMCGELSNTEEKFIAMLHHVIKQLYKKHHIHGVILVIKNMVNFIDIAAYKSITFTEESKRSFCIIHQMCYSLYYKELQKLIKPENKTTDVASFFNLRVGSLIVLSSSGWKENKFLEHLINFISKESVLLMQSCITNKEIVSNSLVELLKTLYKLIESETHEKGALIDATWKFVSFYVDFCLRNQLQNELSKLFTLTPESLSTAFSEGMTVLQKSSDLCKQLNQCECICRSKDCKETSEYPLHLSKYFNTHFGDKISDMSRLFDILSLLKVNFKDVMHVCGSVINVLMEVVTFATKTLLKTPLSEQKNRTLSLLSFVCSLFLHIKSQLFFDASNATMLQCYAKDKELVCSFDILYKDFIAVLRSFLHEQNDTVNQEDFQWLVVLLYKVGVHYYSLKQYNLALPSLEFSIFLCELRNKKEVGVVTCLKDLIRKHNTLAECYSKLQNHKECFHTYLRSIKCFEKLSPEQLRENRSLLETQVTSCVKKRLKMSKEVAKSATFLERCIVDEFSIENENNVFLSLVLECEYYVYKDLRQLDVQFITKRLFTLRKEQYEKAGQMLEYALCMIEMSTCLNFQHQERFHWCSEAIGLVEELYENLSGSGAESEWHVCDVLAVSYFQISVIQYEAKVIKSMENIEKDVNELIEECGNDVGTNNRNDFYDNCILEEDYVDKQFITYLNQAMKMWTKVVERALESESEKDSHQIFHDAEGAAKCLYQAAVFYSLLSQNLNSCKASYLSGLVYQMLSTKDVEYQEKQVASWALTASQFLLVKNVSSGEEILQKLQDTKNCSVFSNLHIEVLRAAYMLYSGKVQSSAETFKHILNNDVLNDNTKSSLVIKSDIYFLLSYLKLIPLKEDGDDEVIISHNEHFPSKSPFPPISDCLKYLRSLYSKYVEGTGVQGVDITISSNWAYLDKLLICLTRNAELLKHQGSILEAKSLLKEALLLTHKYHLSLRTVDILQQLTSMDLILQNKDAFNKTFAIINTILQPTVHNCFCDSQIMLPFFVNHDSQCMCNYCIYPKLQEIHIVLYLQYIESKQRFCQLSSDEYDSSIEVIDVLVENAYNRYLVSLAEVYRIVNMFFPSSSKLQIAEEEDSKVLKTKKKGISKNKNKLTVSKDSKKGDKELFNIFLQYSFEAKINQSFTESQHMVKTLEQLISKVQTSNGYDQTHHEYHRLCAQLYHLRSLLCLDGDVVENMWFSQNNRGSAVCPTLCPKTLPKSTSCVGTDRKDKKLCKTNSNVTTYETPVKPVRRVKQKNMRKGRLYEETTNDTTKKVTKKKTNISNESSTLKCLEDLRKSLAILNPYTDTLIIKAIYQLLILLSGTSNKDLTIACHLLSSSRILHQQMLSACSRKLRDRKLLTSSLERKGTEVLETTSNLLEKFSDPKLVFEQEHVQYLMADNIPEDWCICSLSLTELESKRYLIVCRLQRQREPLVVKINISDKPQHNRGKNVVCDLAAAFDSVDLLEKFNSVMEESEASMKITETKQWWSERVRLDKELKSTISRLEDDWLQGWKGMLLGQCRDNKVELNRNIIADEVMSAINSAINTDTDKDLIKCLLDGFEYCTKYQVLDSLQTLYGEKDAATVYDIFVHHVEKKKYSCLKEGASNDGGIPMRKPVVLILDKTLQKLPWESMNILRGQPVTRMPSLLITSSHCKNYRDEVSDGVAIGKCSYVLNPKDDLKRTEEKFSDWFKGEGWQGIVGRPPTSAEYSDAISENDLFIYCGHGSGQEYLGWSSVHRLQSHAVALLMGCSSGKLLVQGELEAHGMVLYYISAGCPAVVANLWHVTDRDIDLFLEKLLVLWLSEGRGSSNLAECVAKARHACKLEYLNGAAPVVYGLPLFVKHV